MARAPPEVIGKREIACVFLALVGAAGGNTVAKHFLDETNGHAHRLIALCLNIQIGPIFKMMPVAPFVVDPRFGISVRFTLALVRAFVPLEILYAHPKFRGTVLGKVVQKTAPRYPCLKAVPYDRVPMPRDRGKMLP